MNKTLILSIGFISALVTTNATAMLIPSLKRAMLSPQKVKSVSQKRNVTYLLEDRDAPTKRKIKHFANSYIKDEYRDTFIKKEIERRASNCIKNEQRRILREKIKTCDEHIEQYIKLYGKQYEFAVQKGDAAITKMLTFYATANRHDPSYSSQQEEHLVELKAVHKIKTDTEITKLHLEKAYTEKFELLQQLRYIE